MINSANTVDFSLLSEDKSDLLPNEIVPSDKVNQTHISNIPQNPNNARFFSKCPAAPFNQFSFAQDTLRTAALEPSSDAKDIKVRDESSTVARKMRVKVQHLQTHTKLQNNRWNYHTFYNFKSDVEKEIPNTNNNNNNSNTNNNNNINNESAFLENYEKLNDIRNPREYSAGTEESNLLQSTQLMGTATTTDHDQQPLTAVSSTIAGGERTSPVHRTEDQENAFRRIEDVHNYAKLNRYSYSNGSSNSSIHDEEEEEDDVDDDDLVDLDTNYERYFRAKHLHHHHTVIKCGGGGSGAQYTKASKGDVVDEETDDIHVDVETLQREQHEKETSVKFTPDHHARRPMNAFLIFCKRHRAIVKDRYKTLENRAITKILGDWWASLEANDKKCFTNLAQQNKDAFFSANPNFKWYKLPAPPLRTLNTRPSNAERTPEKEAEEEIVEQLQKPEKSTGSRNLFKLADEAQMGELSTLMCAAESERSTVTQCALQQVLGETTQFLSAHMPPGQHVGMHHEIRDEGGVTSCKRRLHSENSFSSNSSEEDTVPKKSSRSCKGKIYQELVNSGQIAAITKKIKIPKGQQSQQSYGFSRPELATATGQSVSPSSAENAIAIATGKLQSVAQTRTVSESELSQQQQYDLTNFDLEEKIKELPALCLDTYLQRKRITKKNKKFSARKRNSNSASSSKGSPPLSAAMLHSPTATPPKAERELSQPPAAVGSQKRKARKESITRRDVSAIENELASLIPLASDFTTINGCYYFNETPSVAAAAATPTTANALSIGSTTVHQFPSNTVSHFNDNSISSTSDLLILAEVAANRTELTN